MTSGFETTNNVTVPNSINFTASADYNERMAKFYEEHEKKLKEENTYYLQRLLSGMNTNCFNTWNTKNAISDIKSIQYYLNCNPNCDISIYNKVDALKMQEPILQEKLAEFEQGKKNNYTIKLNEDSNKFA